MVSKDALAAAMAEAIELARACERSENPRVACLILAADGTVLGRGVHRGAGTPHAETEALAEAGPSAMGATAVVTLEPCSHTGRTGPCTQALLEAGIAQVVFAIEDPSAQAGGGAGVLRDAGVEVASGLMAAEAEQVNMDWLHLQRTGLPLVTAKMAVSLDGRVAGAGGSRVQLTGPEASAWVHRLRSSVDAVMVGAGTAANDDPRLTARLDDGSLALRQPMRVVLGRRPLAPGAHLLDDAARTVQIASPDPRAVLEELASLGVRHVLLEGGPTILRAFLEAGLVDRIAWLMAPVLLGAGPGALPEGGPLALPVAVERISRIGDDVLIEGALRRT